MSTPQPPAVPPPPESAADRAAEPGQQLPAPPVESAPDQSLEPGQPPRPAIEAYVLLDDAPADMGAVLSAIQPGMGDPLAGVPLLPDFTMGVNGAELRIGAHASRVADRALLGDLAVSPMRASLEPVVAGHTAHVRLGITPPSHGFAEPMTTWLNVLAYLVQNLGARAVWIPAQMTVTTDVLFLGDMDRPALNLTRVHALWLDQQQGVSLAFSAGLHALGWRELQVRRHGPPADRFTDLRTALAGSLEQGRLPMPGSTIVLGGTPHHLVEGRHGLDGSPVFELVPTPTTTAPPTAPQKKRRWPFG